MDRGSQQRTPVSGAALVGLALGAAFSSLLGYRIFAGFVAVGLGVGVALVLGALTPAGRPLALVGAGLAVLFPLAVVEQGEGGILWAAAAAGILLSAAFVMRGLRGGSLASLAVSLAAVLHLGLLGSYLVLVAAEGDRLLMALILMAGAFEAAFGLTAARTRPASPPGSGAGALGRQRAPRQPINLKAVAAGIAACQAAALLTRLFLPSQLGLISLLVLGAAVGSGAGLGHVAAAAVVDDLDSDRAAGIDVGVFAPLNALLFAGGAFYYGFRLYLT